MAKELPCDGSLSQDSLHEILCTFWEQSTYFFRVDVDQTFEDLGGCGILQSVHLEPFFTKAGNVLLLVAHRIVILPFLSRGSLDLWSNCPENGVRALSDTFL